MPSLWCVMDEMMETLINASNIQEAPESNDTNEFSEPEACDVKTVKKPPKMKNGKRKRLHAPNWHWKRCKLADHLSDLPDHVIVSILSHLSLKEAARTSVLSRRWKNLWTFITDRLSGLPNNIIVSILSHLTIKEAARTSVLSRRWKNMWTFSSTLDFHYLHKSRPSWRSLFAKRKARFVRFAAWVNHVLSLHKGQTVDKFEVSCEKFGRIRENITHPERIIDKWVKFALRKSVKRLILDFRGKARYEEGKYSLKEPLLRKYSLVSLTVLDLKNVDVTGETLSYILVKCQFLEELCVDSSSTLVELRVPGPLPHLNCLKIKYCFLKYLEIRAINLRSFSYHGRNIPVIFEKAPHLIEASYGNSYGTFMVANMAQQFSSYAACLESLVLEVGGLRHYLNDGVLLLPEFPVLENLRHLELHLYCVEDVDGFNNFCASLLKNCPTLAKLSLKTYAIFGGSCRLKINCLHSGVRVLELIDFHGGCAEQAGIACFMVNNLPSLRKVIIHPAYCLDDNGRAMFKQDVVKFVEEQLLRIMPSTAEWIITY